MIGTTLTLISDLCAILNGSQWAWSEKPWRAVESITFGSELQWRALIQVLSGSTHGDGEHALPNWRLAPLSGVHWEEGKLDLDWITFCFGPRGFNRLRTASSSERKAAVFSSFHIDTLVNHWPLMTRWSYCMEGPPWCRRMQRRRILM